MALRTSRSLPFGAWRRSARVRTIPSTATCAKRSFCRIKTRQRFDSARFANQVAQRPKNRRGALVERRQIPAVLLHLRARLPEVQRQSHRELQERTVGRCLLRDRERFQELEVALGV